MKKLRIILILSIAYTFTNQGLYAQDVVDSDELMGSMYKWKFNSFKSGSEEVKGNPFLFEDWNSKGIVYSKGNEYKVNKLNYNIYKEEIGAMKEKEPVFAYDSQYIDSVKIDNIRLHKLDGKFYEALQIGVKASLYKKYDTRITEGQFNPTDATTTPSRLVIMDDYYVLSQDQLMKFKPSKGNLEDTFGDQAGEMKKIMKEKKLNYKKQDDLIRIFEAYNSL